MYFQTLFLKNTSPTDFELALTRLKVVVTTKRTHWKLV